MTPLLACSMVGVKFPPLFIGRSRNPRVFKNVDFKRISVKYYGNKTAFLTKSIFREYLEDLNAKLVKYNRKILIILDNALQHDLDCIFSHVELLYLSSRTSALIQQLDVGIIKSVKDRYKSIIWRHILSDIDNNDLSLPLINIKDVVLWVNEIWMTIQDQIIINCWRKSGIHISEEIEEEIKFSGAEIEELNEEIVNDLNHRELERLKSIKIDYPFDCNEIDKNVCIIMKNGLRNIKQILYKKGDSNIPAKFLVVEEILEKRIIIPKLKKDIRYYLNKRN